jgi:hypothetical protein
VEGCCLFVTYQWGNPQAPIYRGNADRAKLPYGYIAEKTSPGASASGPEETEKSPSSLDQEGLCKGLVIGEDFYGESNHSYLLKFLLAHERELVKRHPDFPLHPQGFLGD